VTTNLVHGPGTYQGALMQATIQASTRNPSSGSPDTGQITLVMTANDIEPVSNVLTLTVDEKPIESGYASPISVKFTQADLTTPVVGATINWAVYPYVEDNLNPPYDLVFGKGTQTQTDSEGVARNTLTYNGSGDLNSVFLVASAFDPVAGHTQSATRTLRFVYVDPLTGIMINRPWATNPVSGKVITTAPCQVITARMTLSKGQGDGPIKLYTRPLQEIATQLFTMDGRSISQDADGGYTVQTSNGSVDFLVGAQYPAFCGLEAYYPPGASEPLCKTRVWLTQLGQTYGNTNGALTIQNLDTTTTPPVLNMPDKSTWPNPFFTVSVPANSDKVNFRPDDDIVILLNYRVAFTGKVADVQAPNHVDLAYCMLNPTGNLIAYVVGTGKNIAQWGYLEFNASGTAQTYPTTGGAMQTLPAPSLTTPNLEAIKAKDVVNGLEVKIIPFGAPTRFYQPGDEITVYFYLSGSYPLPVTTTKQCLGSPSKIRNIATLQYTVVEGDELRSDEVKILGPLPQWCLAGYGAGTFQMNMRVVRQGQNGPETYWSTSTNALRMDTATVDG
jgi:hypothetical protein